MTAFYNVLARLAAQVLLGLALFLWGVIAVLDTERAALRPWFALGFAAALAALIGLSRGRRWSAPVAAFGLFFPIGILAHGNGASPWLWLFWRAGGAATDRWSWPGTGSGGARPS